MEFISFEEAIKNKLKKGGDTYQKNLAIINDWYKEQVHALTERSSQTIIDWVNEVARKINNDEEVNTNESSDVAIYEDDDFKIIYNYDFNFATFHFINPPDEITAAYTKCLLTAPGDEQNYFDKLTYTIYENDVPLINIGIEELYLSTENPIVPEDNFFGREIEFYDDQL